jgi:Chalcone isomerase-like
MFPLHFGFNFMQHLSTTTRVIGISLLLGSVVMSHAFAQSAATPARTQAVQTTEKAERFPKQIQLEGVKLALNGVGTRYKAIFKVYDMGLYTSAKAGTMQEAINAPGPKKLHFVAHRELSTTEIGHLFYQGIKDNNSAELNLKHMASAVRMSEIASVRSKINPGESFSMEFVPGKGLTFFIMDKPQGAAIGDAEFFSMVMKIWLGNVPADYMLKDALLGIPKR